MRRGGHWRAFVGAICALACMAVSLVGCVPQRPSNPVTSQLLEETVALDALTPEQKAEDFDALLDAMRGSYPYFELRARLDGTRWLDRADEYRARISDTPDNASFLHELSAVLRELGDGHTGVIPPEEYDGMRWIYDNASGHKAWRAVLDAPEIAQKNIAWLKLLHEDEADAYLKADERAQQINESDHVESGLTMEMMSRDAAYIRIPTFSSPFVESDGKALRAFYATIVDVPYLVIDVRGNGGGSDTYWMNNIVSALARKPLSHRSFVLYRNNDADKAFTREVTRLPSAIADLPADLDAPSEARTAFSLYQVSDRRVLPRESINYAGTIVLLVDGGVFSACESFANFAKYTGFAILVGERTGGDGVGIDPMIVALPHSGLIVRFPFCMALNPDGTANAEACTPPDIEADAGQDAQALLELVKAWQSAQERKAG